MQCLHCEPIKSSHIYFFLFKCTSSAISYYSQSTCMIELSILSLCNLCLAIILIKIELSTSLTLRWLLPLYQTLEIMNFMFVQYLDFLVNILLFHTHYQRLPPLYQILEIRNFMFVQVFSISFLLQHRLRTIKIDFYIPFLIKQSNLFVDVILLCWR